MSHRISKQIKYVLSFSVKVITLVSVLVSQSFLVQIREYENNKEMNIAQANSDPWYDTNWAYRKTISVDYTKVGNTDQANFPMLVSFTDTSLKSVANGGKVSSDSGYDIIFTSRDGTKLDHEIEGYNAATGNVVMWVKMPTLYHTVDTVFYMYYGNTSISSTLENISGAWNEDGSSNFMGIWHLKEDPSGFAPQILDSVTNTKNGTSEGSMASGQLASGQIGNGLNFIRSSEQVIRGNMTSVPLPITISGFVKLSTVGINQTIFAHDGNANSGYRLMINTSNKPQFTFGGVSNSSFAGLPVLSGNTWYYIAVTVSGNSATGYLAQVGGLSFFLHYYGRCTKQHYPD